MSETPSFLDKFKYDGIKYFGVEHGHYITVEQFPSGVGRPPGEYTMIRLFTYRPVIKDHVTTKEETILTDPTELISSLNWDHNIKGIISTQGCGETFTYEQIGREQQHGYLNYIINVLLALADMYNQLYNRGDVIPSLQRLLTDNRYKAIHQVLLQLIKNTAEETATEGSIRFIELFDSLCPDCFVHRVLRKLELPGQDAIDYVGCRNCGRSKTFIKYEGPVRALLNSEITELYGQDDSGFWVNWLLHRRLFDFDVVEIIRASDEDVERLAMQVGNDTDETRQSRYQQIRCKVSAKNTLTKNSLRVLQHTFGRVTEIE